MIVLDANVWLSSIFTVQTQHLISLSWLNARIQRDDEIHVLGLFVAEMVGSVARRVQSTRAAEWAVRDLRSEVLLQVHPTDALHDLIVESAIIASLRGADAVHVALARRLNVPLVTWDREIGRNAGRLIDVQEPSLAVI